MQRDDTEHLPNLSVACAYWKRSKAIRMRKWNGPRYHHVIIAHAIRSHCTHFFDCELPMHFELFLARATFPHAKCEQFKLLKWSATTPPFLLIRPHIRRTFATFLNASPRLPKRIANVDKRYLLTWKCDCGISHYILKLTFKVQTYGSNGSALCPECNFWGVNLWFQLGIVGSTRVYVQWFLTAHVPLLHWQSILKCKLTALMGANTPLHYTQVGKLNGWFIW